jgi:hypothetical protein
MFALPWILSRHPSIFIHSDHCNFETVSSDPTNKSTELQKAVSKTHCNAPSILHQRNPLIPPIMAADTFSLYLNPDSGLAASNGTSSFNLPGTIMIVGVTAIAMGAWPIALGIAGWTAGAAGAAQLYGGCDEGEVAEGKEGEKEEL